MNKEYQRVLSCLECVRKVTDFKPEIAVVLGSGLGAFADNIDIAVSIDYKDIEGFPISTVPGHAGRFVFGYVDKIPVVIMQGRVHFYEGYSMNDCVLPIRLMHMLGAETLILTNASGGLNKDFKAGDFMIIEDHISFFVRNPLLGANIDELGTRFPDMSEVYDKSLRLAVKDAADKLKIEVKSGVYVQLTGPSYETPAETRLLAALGADAVGMSTVCEAIAAAHMGMHICGISCVSNAASYISDHPLSHAEVQTAMNAAAVNFGKLMRETIINIDKLKLG